jgi:hypothetical protein
MSDKRGYLQKKGRGAFSGIAWKPRYCVLSVQEGSLRYYTDDKLSKVRVRSNQVNVNRWMQVPVLNVFFSNGNITEQAKGAVDLTQEQLTVRPTAVKKSAFQITSSVRSWWFAAKSDAERDEWIKAIRFVRISLASDLVYFFSCMWDCSDPFNHTNSAVQEAKKSALKFTPTVVTRGSYVSFWSSGCCSVTLTQSNACQLLDLERISEAN